MKRDMDLARALLLYIEEHDFPSFDSAEPWPVDPYTPEQVAEHLRLLIEAGLVTALDVSTLGDPIWWELRLTWSGHDFIELARPEPRWRTAMETARSLGATLTLDVLTSLLRHQQTGP